ncbi:MAG: YitT family protein [Zoogloeaceae bacterium]|nr:YitT family protein [Zoogloeaceae bacterium]
MTDTQASQTSLKLLAQRVTLIVAGSALMAFTINTFVHAGALIPGGFTGLTLLIQKICLRYLDVQIPFSLVLYTLNAIPAFVCFKYVGKKFTLYSVLMVFLCGLMTDFMPHMFIDAIQLHDVLLSAVFGGMLNGIAMLLCLYANATTGGTDFIAIFVSERYRKDAWNHIFVGNCVILAIAASLFSLEIALYSIIFQFTTTMVLNSLYVAYHQKTLLIITKCPEEVYALINESTHHGATALTGTGLQTREERVILYSVVYSDEAEALIKAIHAIDPDAFINVIKTEQINGRFHKRAKD